MSRRSATSDDGFSFSVGNPTPSNTSASGLLREMQSRGRTAAVPRMPVGDDASSAHNSDVCRALPDDANEDDAFGLPAPFHFTAGLDESDEMTRLGTSFRARALQRDYERFQLRNGGRINGAVILTTCTTTVVAAIRYVTHAEATPDIVSIFIVTALCVAAGIAVVLLPGRTPARIVFAVTAVAALVAFHTLLAFFGMFSSAECYHFDKTRLRGQSTDSRADVCALRLSPVVGALGAAYALLIRLPAVWTCASLAYLFVAYATLFAIPTNDDRDDVRPPNHSATATAVILIITAAYLVMCGAIAVVMSRLVLVEFTRQFHQARTIRDIAAQRERLQRVAKLVLPALLSGVVGDVMSLTDLRHRAALDADDASVCVVRVRGYHRWTYELMPRRVVQVMCGLFEVLDEGAAMTRVRRVGVVGDTFTAEAGLDDDSDPVGAAEAIKAFATWAQEHGDRYGTHTSRSSFSLEPPLRVCVGVGRGALSARLAGNMVMRHVVYGHALDIARFNCDAADCNGPRYEQLAAAGDGLDQSAFDQNPLEDSAMLVDSLMFGYTPHMSSLCSPSNTELQNARTASRRTSAQFDESAHAADPFEPVLVRRRRLTSASLRQRPERIPLQKESMETLQANLVDRSFWDVYAAPPLNDGLLARCAFVSQKCSGPASALHAVFALVLLLMIIVQRSAGDRGWGFVPSTDVPALLLLTASGGAMLARAVLLYHGRHLPLALDVPLLIGAAGAFVVGSALPVGTAASNDSRFVAFAMVTLTLAAGQRYHWAHYALVQLSGVLIPTMAARAYVADKGAVPWVIETAFNVAVAVLAVVAARHLSVARRRRYELATLHAHVATHADRNFQAQQELLQRTVPRPFAAATSDYLYAARQTAKETGIVRPFKILHDSRYVVVVRVDFHCRRDAVRSCPDFRRAELPSRLLPDVLEVISDLAAGSVLQLLHVGGDSVVMAGPFDDDGHGGDDADDDAFQDEAVVAGYEAVALLSALLDLDQTLDVCYRAAIDVDWGYGALMGAQHRSYGLLGPVMHCIDAILRAAPRLPTSTAFCTGDFANLLGYAKAWCVPGATPIAVKDMGAETLSPRGANDAPDKLGAPPVPTTTSTAANDRQPSPRSPQPSPRSPLVDDDEETLGALLPAIAANRVIGASHAHSPLPQSKIPEMATSVSPTDSALQVTFSAEYSWKVRGIGRVRVHTITSVSTEARTRNPTTNGSESPWTVFSNESSCNDSSRRLLGSRCTDDGAPLRLSGVELNDTSTTAPNDYQVLTEGTPHLETNTDDSDADSELLDGPVRISGFENELCSSTRVLNLQSSSSPTAMQPTGYDPSGSQSLDQASPAAGSFARYSGGGSMRMSSSLRRMPQRAAARGDSVQQQRSTSNAAEATPPPPQQQHAPGVVCADVVAVGDADDADDADTNLAASL